MRRMSEFILRLVLRKRLFACVAPQDARMIRARWNEGGSAGEPALPRWLSSDARARSVAIVLGLVGAFDGHADVVGLLGCELGEVDAQLVQMQAGDLFVEDLRE